MKELLKFGIILQTTLMKKKSKSYLEDYDFDESAFSEENLSSLSSKETDSLFGDLIGLYMDVSGTYNLGDVYELLTAEISVDEKHAEKLLS